MKNNRWFPVFYMFITTAFFSAIIITLTIATRERVDANAAMALEAAVLRVIPGLYKEGLSGVQLHRVFAENITQPSDQTGGAWVLKKDGTVQAYAVPVSGQGFWAPIKGIIGVAGDGKTVTGIAFYEQSETPGLGAEIETPVWRVQFDGKKLAGSEKALNIKRPGEPLGDHDVHAVTGATQTSIRVEKLINDSIALWRQKLNG